MKNHEQRKRINFYVEKYDMKGILTEELLQACSLFTFNKGDTICELDQVAEFFYFFVEGQAKIYTLLENGKKLLVRFYEPFNILGDIEIINGNKYRVYAEALEKCVCIGLPMKLARSKALQSSSFLLFLCQHLVEKLDTITHKSSMNTLCSLEVRLASYLIQSSASSGKQVEIQSSYTNLAELLGTSYRHLNRTFGELEEKGIIKKKGKFLEIVDRGYLKGLAKDLYK